MDTLATLNALAKSRILVMDGAMGTMIQQHRLEEADYRGTRFADWKQDVKGNNDLLNLTQPQIIEDIHTAFLDAGADIIETNTFNGTTISMADYAMESLVEEINEEGARIARRAADAAMKDDPDRPRFVAGSLGPTNKTLSISPDVNRPGYREVDFDTVVGVYRQQAAALVKGGVDLLLVETIFDTLNAKAALFGIEMLFEDIGRRLPVMVSGTITDLAGRNLSGQTVEAFWHAIRHVKPFSVGLNCSFGAEQLRPHVISLSHAADTLFAVYPNAGLPNEMGEYDETPEVTAAHLAGWADEGLVNIVGGCCGTTPDHIAAIAEAVNGKPPRDIPNHQPAMRLAGLEAVTFT